MALFKKKAEEKVAAPAVSGVVGHPIVVNPNPRSEASYRRHVGRSERLLLALEKAEASGQTERARKIKIELEQRKLAIRQWELANMGGD